MSNDKNIKIYSASDIEKYYKGQLSPKEMNALEKAALDDPFLAEAMEGYALTVINIHDDIVELRTRLENRKNKSKSIAATSTEKSGGYLWLKIAAMIFIVVGAGWLIYQFSFNDKSTEIAQSDKKEAFKTDIKDSGMTRPDGLIRTDTTEKFSSALQPGNSGPVVKEKPSALSENEPDYKKQKPGSLEKAGNNLAAASVPIQSIAQDEEKGSVTDDIAQNILTKAAPAETKREAYSANAEVTANRSKQQGFSAQKQKANNYNKDQQARSQSRTFVFSGRVSDQNNNALPFSNIINTEDSIGTYSDANGYFNLTSTDSVLKVKVSSLGFESITVKLVNHIPNNKILLEEDRSSLSEIQLSKKKVNSRRARDAGMILEKPEPSDGWSNYDIYLANNLKVPENFKNKPTGTSGEVELSFDISKEGLPVNITVKKSLCEICDKEAIRLVKEGPKWKRKNKKGKATVTVAF